MSEQQQPNGRIARLGKAISERTTAMAANAKRPDGTTPHAKESTR